MLSFLLKAKGYKMALYYVQKDDADAYSGVVNISSRHAEMLDLLGYKCITRIFVSPKPINKELKVWKNSSDLKIHEPKNARQAYRNYRSRCFAYGWAASSFRDWCNSDEKKRFDKKAGL